MTQSVAINRFNGHEALALRTSDGSSATVLLHGAHALSWVPAGQGEQFYLSPSSSYAAVAPIRGGVPVIFPQFSGQGPLQRHGFARNMVWELVQTEAGADGAQAVLRLRDDGGRGYLTVKGPIERGSMKVREEQETAVDDARVVEAAFRALGLVVGFRYEKYRTEYSLPGVTLTIDDTPVGVFVELEGEEAAILDAARALGRTADEFLLDSYRALFLARQQIFGLPGPDMLFPRA